MHAILLYAADLKCYKLDSRKLNNST